MGEVFSSDLETYHRAHTKISYQDIVVSSLRCSTVAGVASVRIAIVVSYSRRLSKIDNPWSVFHLSLSLSLLPTSNILAHASISHDVSTT